jgi:hypothetical protein
MATSSAQASRRWLSQTVRSPARLPPCSRTLDKASAPALLPASGRVDGSSLSFTGRAKPCPKQNTQGKPKPAWPSGLSKKTGHKNPLQRRGVRFSAPLWIASKSGIDGRTTRRCSDESAPTVRHEIARRNAPDLQRAQRVSALKWRHERLEFRKVYFALSGLGIFFLAHYPRVTPRDISFCPVRAPSALAQAAFRREAEITHASRVCSLSLFEGRRGAEFAVEPGLERAQRGQPAVKGRVVEAQPDHG